MTADTPIVEPFEPIIKNSNAWMNDVAQALNSQDENAFNVIRGVLKALRDRLSIDEVADFADQLPTLIRGLFYEEYHPGEKLITRTRQGFLENVAAELTHPNDPGPAEAAEAFFQVLHEHASEEEAAQIERLLPEEVADFWNAGNAATLK